MVDHSIAKRWGMDGSRFRVADLEALIGSKAIALGMQILIDCIEFVFEIIEELNYLSVASAIPYCQIRR
jgi:hypothetical protein